MLELIYTSARETFDGAGYGIVGKSQGFPKELERFIRELSRYEFIGSSFDVERDELPVVSSHSTFIEGSNKWHVLSRSCFAGRDHTQRFVFLAHHLVLNSDEYLKAGGVAILREESNFQHSWAGPPKILPERLLTTSVRKSSAGAAWKRVTGDARWARAWAINWLRNSNEPKFLVVPNGVAALDLFSESLELIAPNQSADVTFITHLVSTQGGPGYKWIGLLPNADVTKAIEERHIDRTLNLTKPFGTPEEFLSTHVPIVRPARAVDGETIQSKSTKRSNATTNGDDDYVPEEYLQSRHRPTVSERKVASPMASAAREDVAEPNLPPILDVSQLPRTNRTPLILVSAICAVLAIGISAWAWKRWTLPDPSSQIVTKPDDSNQASDGPKVSNQDSVEPRATSDGGNKDSSLKAHPEFVTEEIDEVLRKLKGKSGDVTLFSPEMLGMKTIERVQLVAPFSPGPESFVDFKLNGDDFFCEIPLDGKTNTYRITVSVGKGVVLKSLNEVSDESHRLEMLRLSVLDVVGTREESSIRIQLSFNPGHPALPLSLPQQHSEHPAEKSETFIDRQKPTETKRDSGETHVTGQESPPEKLRHETTSTDADRFFQHAFEMVKQHKRQPSAGDFPKIVIRREALRLSWGRATSETTPNGWAHTRILMTIDEEQSPEALEILDDKDKKLFSGNLIYRPSFDRKHHPELPPLQVCIKAADPEPKEPLGEQASRIGELSDVKDPDLILELLTRYFRVDASVVIQISKDDKIEEITVFRFKD